MNAKSSRRRLAATALLACLVVGVSTVAVAQPPDVLRSYRLLPRLSTLNETGTFAGGSTDFTMLGTFDLVTGYDLDGPHLRQTAKFANVDAWASHPFLAYVLNVDDVLGLTLLEGTPLPVAAPFDVYKFDGETAQGHPVELYAARIGRWLLMRGETEAPCCDFPKYRVRAVARQTPWADLNEDGEVDRHDLASWAAGFGHAGAADATGDNMLDGGDFLEWQRQLSETPPDFSAADALLSSMIAASPAASAVPEPASCVLIVTAAACAAWASRRRRQ